MRRVTLFLHQFPDIGIVIAFVHIVPPLQERVFLQLWLRVSLPRVFLSCQLAPSTVTEREFHFHPLASSFLDRFYHDLWFFVPFLLLLKGLLSWHHPSIAISNLFLSYFHFSQCHPIPVSMPFSITGNLFIATSSHATGVSGSTVIKGEDIISFAFARYPVLHHNL